MVACKSHHVLRHLPGYAITEIAPGRYQWTTPNGLTYTTGPDHVLRLTADLDNPDPREYRPPGEPLYVKIRNGPDTAADQAA
jgi:hypothetical protein